MRNAILWGVLVLVLGVVNLQIYTKERILTEGERVLLRLAPRDPRSLLQGDYMRLNYSLANDIRRIFVSEKSIEGLAVIKLDQNKVGHFVSVFEPGRTLLPEEKLLFFRKRGSVVRLASDAFFFQEGQGAFFRQARYGELRVASNGDSVLVGLRDGEFKTLDAGRAVDERNGS
ncbi:MAG: GDYXXLXY domain-containing protein [Gammaproteobacteria bacterium]